MLSPKGLKEKGTRREKRSQKSVWIINKALVLNRTKSRGRRDLGSLYIKSLPDAGNRAWIQGLVFLANPIANLNFDEAEIVRSDVQRGGGWLTNKRARGSGQGRGWYLEEHELDREKSRRELFHKLSLDVLRDAGYIRQYAKMIFCSPCRSDL